MRLSHLAAAILACAVAITTATAGINHWTTNGPEGGIITAFVLNASEPATMYAGTYGGVFRSTDGGETWRVGEAHSLVEDAVLDLSISSLAIDTNRPSTLYAGTYRGELLKSIDSGAAWTFLPGIFRHRGSIQGLLMDPTNGTIYLAASSGVFKSTDAGMSWSELSDGLKNVGSILTLAISRSQPSRLYAGTEDGLFTSDGQSAWIRTAFPGLAIVQIAVDPNDSRHIFVNARNRQGAVFFFTTTNGAQTWTTENLYLSGIAFDPSTPSTAYGMSASGIMKTTNRGMTWVFLPVNLIASGFVVDPLNSQILYAWGSGVYKSNDAAKTWRTINGSLTAGYTMHVAVSRSERTIVYAATDAGVFKSSDSGNHWKFSEGVSAFIDLTIDPRDATHVFASSWETAQKSVDGGETWTGIQPNLSSRQQGAHFAIDPSNTATVYAANADLLTKSDDGGTTWSAIGSGQLPIGYYGGFEGTSATVDPVTPSTLYAAGAGSIVKSTDAGAHWRIVRNPNQDPGWFADSLAIDPAVPSTLYTTAYDRGIFRSVNGGESWEPARSGIPEKLYVSQIAVDPVNTSILYAATSSGGVFKSTDRGDHWSEFNAGLPTRSVLSVAIDSTGQTLYAGTAAGVFVYTISAELPLPPGVTITTLPEDVTRLPRLLTQLSQPLSNPSEKRKDAFLIDAAGNISGANGTYFRSDVALVNWGAQPQQVFVAWLEQGKDGKYAPSFRVTLPPAAPKALPVSIPDFVGRLGLSGLGSLVFVAIDSNVSVDSAASIGGFSRIWTHQAGSLGTVSQSLPATDYGELMSHSGGLAIGLRQDLSFRTNVGIVNLDSQSSEFDVNVVGETGSFTLSVEVSPFSMTQVSLGNGTYGAISAEFVPRRAEILWTAYGSSVDQITGDGWVSSAMSRK